MQMRGKFFVLSDEKLYMSDNLGRVLP